MAHLKQAVVNFADFGVQARESQPKICELAER